MSVQAVSDTNFQQEVLQSKIPVLVDFWAEWCGPCRALAPLLEQVAEELAGRVKIVKVDIEKNPGMRDKFAIQMLPTLVVVNNGSAVARRTNGLPKAKLVDWIAQSAAVVAPPEPRAEVFVLSNGLQVVVIPYPRAATVAIRTIYKFGTHDDWTKANLLAEVLAASPGARRRHFVKPDVTLFQQPNVIKDELEEALRVNAERMGALGISEDDVATAGQRVGETYTRQLFELQLQHQMSTALYGAHSGATPVDALSREDVTHLYSQYSAPNNCVVIICGDVSVDEVLQLAEETYGRLPANAEVSQCARPRFVPIERRRRVSVAAQKSLLLRRYVVPGRASSAPGEAEALELLVGVLNVRLMRAAEGERRASAIASAKYEGANLGEGEFVLRASLDDVVATEAEIDRLIGDIHAHGVSEAELAMAKGRLAAEYAAHNLSEFSVAARYDATAVGVTIAGIEARPAAFAKATAADVHRVARQYLDLNRAVTGVLLAAAASPA